MPITALYAALLTMLFVVLSVRVIAMRRGSGAALGDGGNPELLRRIRVQGNFAEYVPLGLVLLRLAAPYTCFPIASSWSRLAYWSPVARMERLAPK
jgi:uncharacterized membrane protein YecN with MAPEG domain